MMPALTPTELARYSRQIRLPGFGPEGQQKLRDARVLLIGTGGLGSPAALYLAAAGVGTLGLADFDTVEAHNLQRQLLHRDSTIGQPKTASATATLRKTNPHVRIEIHEGGINAENARELCGDYDVVLDGADNFPTRYLVNDAAVLSGTPLVHGSVYQFSGQVTVLDTKAGGPCYRCLFPEPPPAGSVPNCGEAGVMGALCGVIGSLQAMEAIKLISGLGESLRGRLFTYDALNSRTQTLAFSPNPACPCCGTNPRIKVIDPANYEVACAPAGDSVGSPMNDEFPLEISVQEAARIMGTQPDQILMIDVREPFEHDIVRVEGTELIPMREIPGKWDNLPADKHLLIMCHHGGRSMQVTQYLRRQGMTNITNIAGGIDAWALAIDPSLPRY